MILWAGVAGAQTVAQDQYAQEELQTSQISALQDKMQQQSILLDRRADRIAAIGSELRETQARVMEAQAQAAEMRRQMDRLGRESAAHRQTLQDSRALYEERARAAYKGVELGNLASLLSGLLGLGDSGATLDSRTLQILLDGHEGLQEYRESQEYLRNTVRQLDQSRSAYRKARKEEQARAEELRRRRAELDKIIAQLRSSREKTQTRLQELRAEERVRIQNQVPVSGGTSISATREARIAQDIVARPVEPLSKKAYERLYRKAAKKYGFARDWYILAAVGKVESNHGENMGPSSAGALGPMQFLPSTWEFAGVDGNGDGVANIMDPRDAIPAAARYLRDGGAPEDWYAALYSYNHADWYVREVLGVAESYRLMAHDNRVGPYTQIKPVP